MTLAHSIVSCAALPVQTVPDTAPQQQQALNMQTGFSL
jgi:hypothetical protein